MRPDLQSWRSLGREVLLHREWAAARRASARSQSAVDGWQQQGIRTAVRRVQECCMVWNEALHCSKSQCHNVLQAAARQQQMRQEQSTTIRRTIQNSAPAHGICTQHAGWRRAASARQDEPALLRLRLFGSADAALPSKPATHGPLHRYPPSTSAARTAHSLHIMGHSRLMENHQGTQAAALGDASAQGDKLSITQRSPGAHRS